MLWKVTNEPYAIDWNADGMNRTLQNIANLLRMRTGETPYLRNVGLDIALQNMNASDARAHAMREVSRNLAEYAPEAELISMFVENRPEGLYIEVNVEVGV